MVFTRLYARSFEIAVSTLLLASCLAFSAACGTASSTDSSPVGIGGAAPSDAGADDGGSDPHPTTLKFVPGSQIQLTPNESRELTVQTSPAGIFPIRFALVDSDDAADAVLDVSEVDSNADGIAHVTLIAPSQPSTFNVRASSTSAAQALQGVLVSARGVTSLRVQPSYTGRRKVSKWTATAQPGVSCSALSGVPPPDGRITAPPAKPDALVIPKVPVGVDLAVTVRAGHYIGGCANVSALSETDGNQVLVYASDRPLNLDATDLSLSFGATDAHPAFDKLLQASASLAEGALLGSSKDDIGALLDGMRTATPSASRDAFDSGRTQGDWDTALELAFGKGAARRLRDPAQRWLSAGLLALDAPDAWLGQLTPLGNGASFSLGRVGSATPLNAGFPGYFLATWSADSNDTLLLGMELTWEPSRLVTALAVAPALAEFPSATSAEAALSLSVDCAQVSQVLLAHGIAPGSAAFGSCDESCTFSLCRSSVVAAWSRAVRSSGAALASLSVTASAAAEVGDEAEASTLTGSWVGELRSDEATAQVSGTLSANSAP